MVHRSEAVRFSRSSGLTLFYFKNTFSKHQKQKTGFSLHRPTLAFTEVLGVWFAYVSVLQVKERASRALCRRRKLRRLFAASSIQKNQKPPPESDSLRCERNQALTQPPRKRHQQPNSI